MELVASSQGVSIQCPSDGKVSFFNSPYPAHHVYTAIDVYPKRFFGDAAPSPVRGEVVKIRRVMCPIGRFFEGSSFDYVILIRSSENPDRLTKILHVAPIVETGEIVEAGEDLGILLRSGYFNFWTEPHIHVEIRKPSDPLRARGAFEIKRSTEIDQAETPKELRGTAIEVKRDYSLISLAGAFREGVYVEIASRSALPDAGIPHYGWIGIHTNDTVPIGEAVKLCGKHIGTIESAHDGMALGKCTDFGFRLGKHQVGLSLFLHVSSNPLIKVVPYKPGVLGIEESEEVSLDII